MMEYLPFYMMYDVGEGDWDEERGRRDYEYMRSAYPDMAKRIMPYVERECDRMEYSGSMMFDEYPDQLQMRMLCRRVVNKAMENEMGVQNKDWLEELIHVLVWHEIMKRRTEYRKYRRRFY